MTNEFTYLAQESKILLYASALGAEVALAYDFLRAIRRVFKPKKIGIAFMDLGFWVFTGYRTFYMMHTYSNGTLRWFAILGILVVFSIYMYSVSKFVLKVEIFLFTQLRKLLEAIKKGLTNILKLSIIKSTRKQGKD